MPACEGLTFGASYINRGLADWLIPGPDLTASALVEYDAYAFTKIK